MLSCLLFAIMGTIAKYLGGRLDSFEVAFARAAAGFCFVLPVMLRSGMELWRTERLGLHLFRSAAGAMGLMSGFYALANMPLAEATAIQFSKPLFTVLLAGLILHESVKMRRWTATGIGFVGVLIMLQPGSGTLQLAGIVALMGAAFAALVAISIKSLMRTEKRSTSLAYMGLFITIITAVPAYFVWQTPTIFEFSLMVLMGGVGSASQLCLMQGYRLGDASALAIFDYSRLPMAFLLGFWIFAELPGPHSFLGASIIIAATIYIARREAILSKTGAANPKPRIHE